MLRSRRLSLLATSLVPLALTAPAPAGPQEDPGAPDPRALLEAAAQAAGELTSATYRAQATVTTAAGAGGSLSGEVRFTEIERPDPLGARLFVRAQAPDPSGAQIPFELIYDGEQVRGQIGDEQVVWYSRPEEAGLELLEVGDQLLMRPLFDPRPFADALADAELELGAEVEVGGVACREVVVQHGVSRRHDRITWALGLEDHLPRRRVGQVHRHGTAQTETLEVTELRKNVGIHPAVFVMRPARGFELKPFVSRRPRVELLPVGEPAPELVLPDSAGGELRLSEQRGKVVVLDFWSTWAVPCRQTMPLVQQLHEHFADDERVRVLGVATQERPDSDPAAFMRAAGFDYGLLLHGERARESFRVVEVPTLYVIGTEGRVLYAHTGLDPALALVLGELIDEHLSE